MCKIHTHTHTHIVQTDTGEGQCCLTEILFREMSVRNGLSDFEGRQRVASCLGGDCSRCGDWSLRKCESHGSCGWSLGVWACMCLTMSGESRKDCNGAVVLRDKREWNLWLHCNSMQVVLHFICSEIGQHFIAETLGCPKGKSNNVAGNDRWGMTSFNSINPVTHATLMGLTLSSLSDADTKRHSFREEKVSSAGCS